MLFTTRRLHDTEQPPHVEAVTYVSPALHAALEDNYGSDDGATLRDWAEAHPRHFFRLFFLGPHEESCADGFAGRDGDGDVLHSDELGPELAEMTASHTATDQDLMRIDYQLRVLAPDFDPSVVTAAVDPEVMMTALEKASTAVVALLLEP